MPNGLTEDGTKDAADIYYASLSYYPYQMYINWVPMDEGNVLYNDKKFATLLYQWHCDAFTEYSKVSDAGAFVKNAKFDKLGAFMYSKEEGTPAARLPEQIHGNTKKARYNKIMAIQQKISKENLEKKIGKVYEALIEDISFDGKYLIGRTKQDVPEEDGIIYIKNAGLTKMVNKFVNVEITDVKDYDLIGKLI